MGKKFDHTICTKIPFLTHGAGFNLLQLVRCQLLEKRICLVVWVQRGPDVELWGQKKEAGGSVSLQRVKDQQDVDKLTNQETSTP